MLLADSWDDDRWHDLEWEWDWDEPGPPAPAQPAGQSGELSASPPSEIGDPGPCPLLAPSSDSADGNLATPTEPHAANGAPLLLAAEPEEPLTSNGESETPF